MIKKFLGVIILLSVHKFSFGCNPLWDNQCKINSDCCSGYCDRPDSWLYGVCKPSSSSETCKPLWYNQCTSDSECCSGFCVRGQASWRYGVCKPSYGATAPAPETPKCQDNYYNQCTANSQCCSNFCDRDPSWLFGVCKPPEETGERTDIPPDDDDEDECKKNGFTPCIFDKQCCSGFCQKDGNWYSGVCKQEAKVVQNAMCGVPISNFARPAISLGKHTELGEFPWHAGIYEKKDGNWQQICGGTLISHKVVVSAAHCFDREDKKDRKIYTRELSSFRIGLGKYYRPLYAHEDDMAQIIDVEDIQFSPQYQGSYGLWANDIAFVTLEKQAEYTNAVRPVCIDLSDNSEDEELIEGAMGKIVGWGLTEKQVE